MKEAGIHQQTTADDALIADFAAVDPFDAKTIIADRKNRDIRQPEGCISDDRRQRCFNGREIDRRGDSKFRKNVKFGA